jgi:hexosaminidase
VLIPQPATVVPGAGSFTLDARTVLAAAPELARVAGWLRGALGPATDCPLWPGEPGPGAIELVLADGLAAQEYRLIVGAERVRIEAGDPAGAFYGAQTLRQLLPAEVFRRAPVPGTAWSIGAVTIQDRPRFGWRGCLLDVARHFLPKADLLRYIDLLAMHKLNVLHLHLTDDQGWRLESRRFPRLTEVGGWRRESMVGHAEVFDGRPHGGYYTQDDIREIVAYAADRFITVLPEIDIPGHSEAAIAAYPHLGNRVDGDGAPIEVGTRWGISENVLNVEDGTLDFYRAVLDEVMELFPSEYICVGGDECAKAQWRTSPHAQGRIAELGLRDEHELQSWFIRQLDDHLTARGRRLYGWDEIIEGGLAPGATVAAWRGRAGAIAAARAGHDVVSCPHSDVYLDYRQSDRPDEPIPIGSVTGVAEVYAFEPVPAELTGPEAARVIGAQANLWSEHVDSPRMLDYMAFPRLAAFAEVVWRTGSRDLPDFMSRLARHEARLTALGVEYRRADGPLPWQTRPDVVRVPRQRVAGDDALPVEAATEAR